MTETTTQDSGLRVFEFHGLLFPRRSGLDQGVGDCPFCKAENKFHASIQTGKWDCKSCGQTGNPITFIRAFWEACGEPTESDLILLTKQRKLLNPQTFSEWGVRKSPLTGDWLVPGYSTDKRLQNLYKYVLLQERNKTPRWRLLSSPGFNHHLHGPPLYDSSKPEVWLCEGPWDAMCLWEILRWSKRVDVDVSANGTAHLNGGINEEPLTNQPLALTASRAASLSASINVLASPGSQVYSPAWASLFSGKRLVLLYDNDHPRIHPTTNKRIEPSGYAGMRRIAQALAQSDTPPLQIHFLRWGSDENSSNIHQQDHDPALPSGYDIRDFLTTTTSQQGRTLRLSRLMERIQPIPDTWVAGRSTTAINRGDPLLEPKDCHSWNELIQSCRKAFKWIEGLDRAFSIMLAVGMSTRIPYDQLWIRIISPPATGKTQLCDSLGVARKYVKEVGNFTGFHSGFQTDPDGKTDHSLLSKIKDKTLIVKDGDTILKSPNREKALSQARDAYDTYCSVAYGNNIKREYKNHRFGFILCGTEALLEMDSADLGSRFIDCVIMDDIDAEHESAINHRTFHRLTRNRGKVAGQDLDSAGDPAQAEMKALTGGYLIYLREHAHELLERLNIDNENLIADQIDKMAQFVAFMRARPSKKQDEHVTREMSARLNSQLGKLAYCLAVVMQRSSIDEEVMRRTRRCALDTARGKSLKIARTLYDPIPRPDGTVFDPRLRGMDIDTLCGQLREDRDKTLPHLRFLRKIGIVQLLAGESIHGVQGRPRWRLSDRLQELYQEVVEYGRETKAV